MFKNNPTLQQAYSVDVRNKFDLFQELDGSNTKKYQKFIEAINYAAQKILPTAA